MEKLLHVGINPDGNRKGANESGKSYVESYKNGAKIAVQIVETALERGDVGRMVFYVLSPNNCKRRPVTDIEALLVGVEHGIELFNQIPELTIKCWGDFKPPEVGRLANMPRPVTENSQLHLDLLLNYSPEWDFETRPIRTEAIPNLDVVMRTGEPQLSGFLPLQSAGAQLYFEPYHWKDFSSKAFNRIIDDYKRVRADIIAGA